MSPDKPRWLFWLWPILALWMGGCSGLLPTPTLLPTDTPSPVPSDTPTIIWFPATFTPTSFPTLAAQSAPEERSGVGKLVLSDNFTDTNQWSTAQNYLGSVAFGEQELTLAAAQPLGDLISLRKTSLPSDSYLEITVNLSMCRGADSYGLLLRASTQQDFYRFMISCKGQLRLERLKNGQIALLQDWIPSGQVQPGSPLGLRLGVWAAGNELRFFVNDVYQFSARDPVWTNGKIGVFARASGDTPLTVSFSDLLVYNVTPPLATPIPTITPTRKPTATLKKP